MADGQVEDLDEDEEVVDMNRGVVASEDNEDYEGQKQHFI